MIVNGGLYFRTPIINSPNHELHQDRKPSGLIGHGVGIIGFAMMVLILLNAITKRSKSI